MTADNATGIPKTRQTTLPMWAVITFIIGILVTGGTTVAGLIMNTSSSQHLAIEGEIKAARDDEVNLRKFVEDKNALQDAKLSEHDKMIATLAANQANVLKILDRLERGR